MQSTIVMPATVLPRVEPAPLYGPWAPQLDPDSSLVRAAADLLAAHLPLGNAGSEAVCARCGEGFPCPAAVHASFVCRAAGITRTVEQRPTPGAMRPAPRNGGKSQPAEVQQAKVQPAKAQPATAQPAKQARAENRAEAGREVVAGEAASPSGMPQPRSASPSSTRVAIESRQNRNGPPPGRSKQRRGKPVAQRGTADRQDIAASAES